MGLSRSWVSAITVEPCMFFFSLCNGMFVIIAQNLYIAKADMLAVFDATTAQIEMGIIVNKLPSMETTWCLVTFEHCQTSPTCLPRCAR